MATALIVTIPAKKLQPFLEQTNLTDMANRTKGKTVVAGTNFTNLDSDVYIIHSPELTTLFRLKMASVEVSSENFPEVEPF